jgi:hypothetical protein
MNIIDSLQVTIHSLAMNSNGRHKHQNGVWSDTRKINFLHKLPMHHGTFYFVEFELMYLDDLGVKKNRKVPEGDVSRYPKNRPWHSDVKRFCSRKRIGSGN